jgi:hypothetical protein
MDNSIMAKQIVALVKSDAHTDFIERLLDEFEEKIRLDELSEKERGRE